MDGKSKANFKRSFLRRPRLLKLITRLHIAAYRLTQGAVGGLIDGVPNLLLTTTGRKTGRSFTTPLFFLPHEQHLVVVASYGGSSEDPQWWKNLQANGQGSVEVGPHRWRVTAKQAEPELKERLWPVFCRNYPAYAEYQRFTDRVIPLVVLTPQS
jgi:F420H(2)-dependent quinone reductase